MMCVTVSAPVLRKWSDFWTELIHIAQQINSLLCDTRIGPLSTLVECQSAVS